MRTLLTQLFVIGLIYSTLIFEAFARAGGGGGGGGGGGSGRRSWQESIALIVIGVLFALYRRYKLKKKGQSIHSSLLAMSKRESTWEPKRLLIEAEKKFLQSQICWSKQDINGLREFLHPNLYEEWEKELKDQKAKNRVNEISDITVEDCFFVDVQNYINDEKDCFTVYFNVSCKDFFYENGKKVSGGISKFEEFWTFEWENGEWRLLKVSQIDAWEKLVNRGIINEMKSHHNYKKAA